MSDTPSSLIELQSRFPDDAACARYHGRVALARRVPLPALR